MRRNISCHGHVLEDICTDKNWYKVVKSRNHVCIPEVNPIRIDDYVKDTPDNIWEILDRDGVNVHDMDNLTRMVSSDRKNAISRPNDIFIYDDDAEKAAANSTRYGTVILPSDKTDLFSLTIGWTCDLIKGQQFSWSEFFKPYHMDPSPVSNSLVLIDRYLFAGSKDDNMDYTDGVKNLFEILDEILPREFDDEYHVLCVFDSGQIRNGDFNSVADEVKKMQSALCRTFKIIVELLSVNRADSGRIYSETHDRRIISNYYRITASHSFTAFTGCSAERRAYGQTNSVQKSVYSQNLRFEPIYEGIDNPRQNPSSLPVKGCDDIIDVLSHSLVHMRKNKNEYTYINVNNGCKDIAKIRNRMLH